MDIYFMNPNILANLSVGVAGGGVVEPSINKLGQIVQTNYGTMKSGIDSSFFIIISPTEEQKITNLSAYTSCGCTTAKAEKKGDGYYIKVKYDTKRLGSIRKTVTVEMKLNGEQEKIFFKLTGKVIS